MNRPDDITRPDARWWWASAMALLRHPDLWVTAISAALRLAAPGWWRRRPFLPLPDPDYLAFRLETQYGRTEPRPTDLLTYLRWLRRERRNHR